MSKKLQCPHYFSISGVVYGCMNGRFPCDCEKCDCPDKEYVEVTTTSACISFDSDDIKNKTEKMKQFEDIIICACSSPEHQILFRTIDTDDDVYMSIHLCKLRWYERLRNGLKYIFGYTSKYGDFDEIILTKEHLPKIKKVVKWLETDHLPIEEGGIDNDTTRRVG